MNLCTFPLPPLRGVQGSRVLALLAAAIAAAGDRLLNCMTAAAAVALRTGGGDCDGGSDCDGGDSSVVHC
jgi:hypothetical protein